MRLVAPLRHAVGELLQLLLPPACPLCGQLLPPGHITSFCPACRKDLPPLVPPACRRCALPFATINGDLHLCETCLREESPAFARVHAAGLYHGLLREAVHRFKYRGEVGLDQPLGRLLAERLTAPKTALLVPVPLHTRRLRERSYNQSLLLARVLSQALGLPVAPTLLQRTRETPPQQGLPASVRRRNLQGAFALAANPAGRQILLVDDVMTTGSTVRECARVLCAGDAAGVEVAIVARAGRLTFNPAADPNADC